MILTIHTETHRIQYGWTYVMKDFFLFSFPLSIRFCLSKRNVRAIALKGLTAIPFFLLFFSSCSMTQKTHFQKYLSPDERDDVLSNIIEQEEKVSSFYTLGSITVKGWVWESDADILIAAVKDPLKIKIEITHTWGRPLLHLLIHDGQLEVLSFDEKRIYLGDFTSETLSRFLPGVMADPDLIWTVLRAYPHLIKDYRIGEPGPGRIHLYNLEEEEIIDLDMENLKPIGVSFPEQKIRLLFSDLQEKDGIVYASEVKMNHDQEKKTLILHNKRMVFNTSIPAPIFAIKTMANFERVILDEDR